MKVAEREGFEPSKRLDTPYSLSRRAPSTTRPPLQFLSCDGTAEFPKGAPPKAKPPRGGGGIRTHETRLGPTVFKTVSLDHSDTPPGGDPPFSRESTP